jgi:hydroxypyruvate isomerase
MVPGAGGIKNGLNNKSMHAKFLEDFRNNIKATADAGWPNVICMAGDRKGIGDEEGMDNCHTILEDAVKIAEDYGVVICMELLNSKVNHAGYMCDFSTWGFELCRRVDSPGFKMLYDIYHMQIMEGDLAPTIEAYLPQIPHMQLADTPGRHEPGTGEINYPFLFDHIDRIGYDGWIGCEYKPAGKTEDGLGWLKPYL